MKRNACAPGASAGIAPSGTRHRYPTPPTSTSTSPVALRSMTVPRTDPITSPRVPRQRGGRPRARTRSRARPPASPTSRSGAPQRWQSARASASAASGELGGLGQAQQADHHRLHLGLLGVAVAGDRVLHLVRAVLDDRDPEPGRGRQREPTRLADRHRGAHVDLEQHPLDRQRRRARLRRPGPRARPAGGARRSGSGWSGGVRITPYATRRSPRRALRRRGPRRRRSHSATPRGRSRARDRLDRTRVRL